MLIYKATNRIKNKVYIGQTVKPLNKRISAHKTSSKKLKTKFYNAINKYGFENFDWEIIDTAINMQELNEKEKYWIAYYNTYQEGYNSTAGGDNIYTEQAMEKTRNKNKLPFSVVLQKFKEKNYTLLLNENDYKGVKYKADFLCNNGHLNNVRLYSIVNVDNCCKICKSLEKRRKYEDVKSVLSKNGFTLLDSKQEIAAMKIAPRSYNCLCPKNHKTKININSFVNGTRCRNCHNESIKGKTFGDDFSKKIKLARKKDGTYIHLLQNEILAIKEALNKKLSCYHITKYILHNKYSYKVVTLRIKELKEGILF